MSEGFLTQEEVEHYLETDRTGIERLIHAKKLNAFKLGGTYLRFPKDQVLAFRQTVRKKGGISRPGTWSRFADFWRYQGFYFICTGLLIVVMVLALQ